MAVSGVKRSFSCKARDWLETISCGRETAGVTGRHGRKFFRQIFCKVFGESWVTFHGTGFLGGAPLGPPPGLEVDLIRLTTPAVTHEWSVANVDAILATLDQLYVAGRPRPAVPRRLSW